MCDQGALADAGPLTLGTAGHVDHGKTTLVRALTGTDTDRLAEEKARGMSIELGYAQLRLPGGRSLSVVDVPGHERFVRTMVAGASGIDCFLMVIAANEGVMTQTREHARILQSLGVRDGVVAVTKADVADPRAAISQARSLFNAEIVACRPRCDRSLGELLAAVERCVTGVRSRGAARGPAILHIDRVFTIAGAGTVVTGTLASGAVASGDRLILHPRELEVRVRAVQVHGEAHDLALAGQRVALNLARVSRDQVQRGDVVATRGALTPTHILDVELDFDLGPARDPTRTPRVQVHHGTRATTARIVPAADGRLAQLRCQEPLFTRNGERVLLRDHARRETLGGAAVVDALARHHGPAGLPARPGSGPVKTPATVAPAAATRTPRTAPAPAPPPLSPDAISVADVLRRGHFSPPQDRHLDPGAIAALRAHGIAVRLVHGRHAHADAVTAAAARVRALLAAEEHLSLPRLRDELGCSRAEAKAFLDYFDAAGLTLRLHDDRRVLRRRRRT